jgi:hypothetical protein
MAKRKAIPVAGGIPVRPMRIAAQVVPQIRVRTASDAQVFALLGFRVDP